MNRPVNFYQLTRCTDKNAFTAMLKYQSGNFTAKSRSNEILSMKILADALYSHGVAVSEMDGFVLSASFRFGKEFDLLKINADSCLNIELKSSLQNFTPEQAEEKVRSQLMKNKHYLSVLGRKLYLYTVVTDSMQCYHMTEDGSFQEVDFSQIVKAVKQFFGAYETDIESLFRPSEYLVSPLNHARKFIAHSYFLTHDQEEKKKEILERIRSESVFFGLTGEAGTGKTLMLYDIARELARNAPVLMIHCASEIPVGLSAIGHEIENLTILRPKDLQNQNLPEFLKQYQYILTDETQRVYSGLISQIHDYIREKQKSAFICFDSRQTLSVQEEHQNIAEWAYQHCDKIYTLKNTIRTNAETRPSRLFSSMWKYMKRSATVITRSFVMYKPLKFFSIVGGILFLLGAVLGIRFLIFMALGDGKGHVQSLILTAILIMMGFQTITIGLLGDTIAANRKILEDVQYRVRKIECDPKRKRIKSHEKKADSGH